MQKTYAIVRRNADAITNGTAIEREEDGMGGCGRGRCGNDEGCGELHVGLGVLDA